jgi:hypothetical protein
MPAAVAKDAGKRRARGSIRKRGNLRQVLVYAGLDPLTGQRTSVESFGTAGRLVARPWAAIRRTTALLWAAQSSSVHRTSASCCPRRRSDIFILRSVPRWAAVRWDWVKTNPAEVAKKPRQPVPQPNPPTAVRGHRRVRAGGGRCSWPLSPSGGCRSVHALPLRLRGETIGTMNDQPTSRAQP